MTGFLASVSSVSEARIALEGGADVIDLKQPAKGVLGEVSCEVMRDVVRFVAGRRTISATVGDLPNDPELICPAVERTAACGADIVKVGLFETKRYGRLFEALGKQTAMGIKIVVVLFADRDPDMGLLELIAEQDLTGVMLDTADKCRGSLRRQLDRDRLAEFVAGGRALGLITGLAGSLRRGDIAPLLDLEPDYLGFRSALCMAGNREDVIDADALRAVRAQIPVDAIQLDYSRVKLASNYPYKEEFDGSVERKEGGDNLLR